MADTFKDGLLLGSRILLIKKFDDDDYDDTPHDSYIAVHARKETSSCLRT